MKIFFLIITLITSIYAKNEFHKELSDFQGAIGTFAKAVETFKSNVYFFEDEKGTFHVNYDKESKMESENSFLQIYASMSLKDTIRQYRIIKNRKNLYIKKFNTLYFIRLSNKLPEHTRKMYIELKKRYPDIYYSRAVKQKEKKPEIIDNDKHEVVFLGYQKDKVQTNILKNIVFSVSSKGKFPSLKNRQIIKEGGLGKVYSIRDYTANFSIVRGDILGINNAGLYGFEAFTNYGLLCSTSEDILYLVSKKEIKSIYDLRRKSISVGNISDMAQIYLKEIAKNSGVILDINFKSFSFSDSMNMLSNDKLDAFFMFAPKEKILSMVKKGLYISSMPDDFTKLLNTKDGLKKIKYRIDGRLIRSYKVPNFVVGVVDTLDTKINDKIKDVVKAFECYKQVKVPDAFYGKVHPYLAKAIESIQADIDAKKLLEQKSKALSIKFFKEKKSSDSKLYYYQITNDGSDDVNLTFTTAKTKAFDKYAFKPRHLLNIQLANPIIEVKANSKRLISFKYHNPFSTRLKNLKLDLNFKTKDLNAKEFSIPLIIGDE